ncbi:hypothetical protein DDZ18_09925 [Marinicauda salina]|uniref:Cyclic di-GMP-binding protein n=1 Tax=Marinicauda salina TaxID=2135793 RepID=A0A2U2BSM1_9PROT|nr:hypothetical protein [Marinicauda salina]PWE17013.1 hypothetical protein DDZ18_09925 [Marinicauda salina]
MSIRIGLLSLVGAAIWALLPAGAASADHRPARSEEHVLSRFVDVGNEFPLDAARDDARITFSLAPGAEAEAIELVLAARPRSDRSGGRIAVTVNRSQPVILSPRPEAFEARFSLYSDALQAGDNTLTLRFEGEGVDGWTIDAEASRLRVAAAPADGYESLDAAERALGADFAAPRRIHLATDAAGPEQPTVAALAAQALALRMGEAPILVSEPEIAELVVSAEIAPVPASVTLADPTHIRLAAGDRTALVAAARLFAARSFIGQDQAFNASHALNAPRLTREGAGASGDSGLSALAAGGAPFGADQGGRAAVVFATETPEERAAALTVVARAALASGSAWIYGWFGDDARAAPDGHDIMVLGPEEHMDSRLFSRAPAELRAAADAAASRAPRERRFRGSTAFAAEETNGLAPVTGVAGMYEDGSGRTIVLITSPRGADFARAARRLARSALWSDLRGSAALWDTAMVTPFGPGAQPMFSRERVVEFMRAHDRWLALGAFSLSVLLLLTGGVVNQASRRTP